MPPLLSLNQNLPASASGQQKMAPKASQPIIIQLKFPLKDVVIDFGRIPMLSTKQMVLELRNPGKFDLLITLERLPVQRGFALMDDPQTPPGLWEKPGSAASIPAKGSLRFCLAWTPNEVGSVKDVLELALTVSLSERQRFALPLRGYSLEAEGPLKKRVAKQPARQLNLKKPALHGGLLTAGEAGATAEDDLARAFTSLSASTSAGPRPSLASEGFKYRTQDAWFERQERAFTAWINGLLSPPEEGQGRGVLSRSERAIRARVTASLASLYKRDADVRQALIKVEELVEKGQLAMNAECSAVNDVSLRDRALRVLQELHPLWLQLVLEVVCGTTVLQGDRALEKVPSESEVLSFARTLFLSDRGLERAYLDHNGRDGLQIEAFAREMGKLLLKRTLAAALLLDRAQATLAQSDPSFYASLPLLFRKDSQVKASLEWLQALLSGSLKGQGDLGRHLSLHGYKLHYRQDPLRELEVTVGTLAVDLRDGTRLCRLAEVLTDREPLSLLRQCQVPTSTRLMKEGNVQVALAALQQAGMSLGAVGIGAADFNAADVVDGLRDRTLGLLWRMFSHFQLARACPKAELEEEVARLSNLARHRSVWIEGMWAEAGSEAALPKAGEAEPMAAILTRWAQSACAAEGLRIGGDLSQAFADGSALCLLVRRYQPHLIPRSGVYVPPYLLPPACDQDGWRDLMGSGSLLSSYARSKDHQRGVKRNYGLLKEALGALGGMPVLLAETDFTEALGVDPRVALCVLATLAPRVLFATKEDRAALRIQRWWRLHLLRHKPWLLQLHRARWEGAAMRIQRAWRAHSLRKGLQESFPRTRQVLEGGVLKLQALWRQRTVRREFLQQRRAAVLIQSHVRGFLARKHVHDEHVAPKVLQAALQARRLVSLQRWAREALPHIERVQATRRMAVQRRAFQSMRHAALTIQRHYRGHLGRREALQLWREKRAVQHAAATKIQAVVRAHQTRRWYLDVQRKVVRMQALVRGFLARRRALALKGDLMETDSIEAWFRRQNEAATRIQAAWRGYRTRAAIGYLRGAFEGLRLAEIDEACRIGQWESDEQRAAALRARAVLEQSRTPIRARPQGPSQEAAAVRLQRWWRRVQRRRRDAFERELIEAAAHALMASKLDDSDYSDVEGDPKELARRAKQAAATAAGQVVALPVAVEAIEGRGQGDAGASSEEDEEKEELREEIEYTKRRLEEAEAMYEEAAGTVEDAREAARQAADRIRSLEDALQDSEERSRKQMEEALAAARRDFEAAVQAALERERRAAEAEVAALRDRMLQAQVQAQLQLSEGGTQTEGQAGVDTAVDAAGAPSPFLASPGEDEQTRLQRRMAEERAALRIQAFYRGHLARRRETRPEVAEARRRLAAALQRALANRGLQIRNRVTRAMDRLVGPWNDPSELTDDLQTLRMCTETLGFLVDLLVARNGLQALVRLMRACRRTDAHMEVLQLVFCILDHVCSHNKGQYVPRLLYQTECLAAVCELLQRFRDREAVFSGAALLFYHLTQRPRHAAHVASDRGAVRTVDSLLDLLGRKYERDKIFLVKLEGRRVQRKTQLHEIAAKAQVIGKQLDLLRAVFDWIQQGAAESERAASTAANSAGDAAGVPRDSEGFPIPQGAPKGDLRGAIRHVKRNLHTGLFTNWNAAGAGAGKGATPPQPRSQQPPTPAPAGPVPPPAPQTSAGGPSSLPKPSATAPRVALPITTTVLKKSDFTAGITARAPQQASKKGAGSGPGTKN